MRPRQLPLLSLFLVGAAGAGASAAAGCENNPAHIFIAVQYDPVRDCLLAEDTIDAVEGADRGPCATTRCWETPAGNVYVSTTACDAPSGYVACLGARRTRVADHRVEHLGSRDHRDARAVTLPDDLLLIGSRL